MTTGIINQAAVAAGQAAHAAAQHVQAMDRLPPASPFCAGDFCRLPRGVERHPALHTPLMAVTNAVSGIIVVGAMLQTVVIQEQTITLTSVLGAFGGVSASINIFGGFLVTERMLDMFKRKKGS